MLFRAHGNVRSVLYKRPNRPGALKPPHVYMLSASRRSAPLFVFFFVGVVAVATLGCFFWTFQQSQNSKKKKKRLTGFSLLCITWDTADDDDNDEYENNDDDTGDDDDSDEDRRIKQRLCKHGCSHPEAVDVCSCSAPC